MASSSSGSSSSLTPGSIRHHPTPPPPPTISYSTASVSMSYASRSTALTVSDPGATMPSLARCPRTVVTETDSKSDTSEVETPAIELPAGTFTPQPDGPVSASAISVVTYDSAYSEAASDRDDDCDGGEPDGQGDQGRDGVHEDESQYASHPLSTDDAIPPLLPPYRAPVPDAAVRPATPASFARLFPSLDRLSVRHDEFTPDGNMNLRIDTLVHADDSRRPPVPVQLFHLRLHDLARREFSLRRYCRDSGREVCSSKRAYVASSAVAKGAPGTMSSVFHSIKTPFAHSTSTFFKRYSLGHIHSLSKLANDSSTNTAPSSRRPSVASSVASSADSPPPSALLPTETTKLEFSNYARVDITRRKGLRYVFSWWGYQYAWDRVVDLNIEGGPVSFHLRRDGHSGTLAHIVPEPQSPSDMEAAENAGGWIPPCHMWISNKEVLDTMTDMGDVIVATGLAALVDDSIKRRWQVKVKPIRRPSSLRRGGEAHKASTNVSLGVLNSLFRRKQSRERSRSPLRFGAATTL